jgi:general secretion pathway protein A
MQPCVAKSVPLGQNHRSGRADADRRRLMYEQHYHFTDKPFGMTPDRKYLFASESYANALATLQGAVADRLCFAAVTGDVGTGKTTLCRALADQGDRKTLPALLLNPPVSEEELLAQILASLGLLSRENEQAAMATRVALANALQDFLQSLVALGATALLVIDEAQHMPPQVLDHVRMLSNLAMNGRPLLQVVLVGQPSLVDVLGSPELRELDERLSVRCQLDALSADETASYILHRLAVADTTRTVTFTADACALVYRYSLGVPRVVNLICHRALMAGFSAKAMTIDGALVAAAVEGLELTPPAPVRRSWFARFRNS